MDQQSSGAALTALANRPVDYPKSVRIQAVENGLIVNLEGGRPKADEAFRHSRTHVAKTSEEALQIASEFLSV